MRPGGATPLVFTRVIALTVVLVFALSGLSVRDARAQQVAPTRGAPLGLRPDSSQIERIVSRQAQEEIASGRRLADFQRAFSDPLFTADGEGRLRQLRVLPSLRPTYAITHAMTGRNAAALATIGAHLVLPGAALGFDVDGSGERMGLWDASGVRLSHREWAGRVEQRDTPVGRRNHASHVAGTLIASGVRIEARGAAPGATLVAHDWNNDLTEMAAWALDGGLVSNHSYGTAGGWVFNARGDGLWAWLGNASVSGSEDARFGRYDEQAASWDEIAAAAPAYLIVKSAGNERADWGPEVGAPYNQFTTRWERAVTPRPADGGADGFDTILDASLAKNVLTVGSVGDMAWDGFAATDVRLSSFSSMGPADDGRIKPDLVASGEYVESAFTFSDDAYGTSTGTSHAAPAVAGATLLLQEVGRRAGGAPLSAASMKALLIHTALDVGPAEGPDYGFGWGLVRVPQAAAHVASGQIVEGVLAEGETVSQAVELADGEPLHVTLAWTDPAGTPAERVLDDRRPVLVNDLDLWVETPGGAVIWPWTLDPDHPGAAASRGRNRVDNVEQVSVAAPGSGTFVVHLTHTGVLKGGAQAFSLLTGRVPLPAAGGDAGDHATHQLAGRIRMGGTGLHAVQIRLTGPVEAETTSGRDGAYRLEGLPAGRYTIRVEFSAGERPPLEAGPVDLPRLEPLDVNVAPLLSLESFELLRTPRLLEPGESAAERRTVAEAGGVYGAELFFEAGAPLASPSILVELDVDSDPLAAPWIGERARQWVTDLSAWRASPVQDGPDNPSTNGPGARWRARLPLIWISGEARPGDTVSIGLTLRSADSGVLLAVDTLRIPVGEPDHQAPLARFRARLPGLAFSPVGGDAPVEATFWDGSDLVVTHALMVFAADTTVEVARVPLADNGDLVAFQDFVPGDGVFSGEFAPPEAGDFRLILVAEDALGNRSRRMTRVVYSSRPYDKGAQTGLWTSSYFESSTAHLWSGLGLARIQAATWDTFVRGQPPPGAFRGHDMLAWAPSASDVARAEVQAEINALLQGGTRLVIMLPESVPEPARAWLQRDFGILVQPPGTGGAFSGVDSGLAAADVLSVLGEAAPVFEGWAPQVSARERIAALEPMASEVSVLLVASRPLVVRSGRALVTTLRAEHVSGAAARAGFLARLLLVAAGDEVALRIPASAPDTVLVHTGGQAGPDSLVVQWSARPVARYEAALENAALEEITAITTRDTTWTLAASQAVFASRIRIRSLTPTDTSAWAVFPLNPTVTSREPLLPASGRAFVVRGVYPQPAAHEATVIVDSPVSGWLDVRIHSVLGQMVGRATRWPLVAGENRIDLSLGHLAPGVYFIQMNASSGHAARASVVKASF